jgi:transcriptional regulator with XRE-family HTH domain
MKKPKDTVLPSEPPSMRNARALFAKRNKELQQEYQKRRNSLGDYLYSLRYGNPSLRIFDVASVIGIHQFTLRQMELGKQPIPVEMIDRVALAYGVEVNELMGYAFGISTAPGEPHGNKTKKEANPS